MRYDVAIIGGGVTGCAIARELSRHRLRIAVIEKECEVGFGTSKSNSGIIHAGHHSSPDSLKGALVVEGSEAFPELARELKFGYRQIGEIVVARNADEIRVLETLMERGRAKGVRGLEMLTRDALLAAEPNLSPKLQAGLLAPTAAVINPYEYCFSLVESARRNGVELFTETPVLGITVRDGFFSIKTPSQLLHARFIVNAAGLYADRIARMVGLSDFAIHPRKGEEYMLDKRMRGVVQHIIFPVPGPKSKGTLIIPTFDGTIMVGPTAEDVDSRCDLATTDKGAGQVFEAARGLVPSIHPRDTIAEFAGLRAIADGNDFIIGPTAVPGFINAAGIQSPGLTATPAIARRVQQILADEGLTLTEKIHFEPRVDGLPRFSSLSSEEQFALVAAHPGYARIVCRCEEVTEHEVSWAVDQGARTLDGLKFRVRAGMGRCQGGFCTLRLMEILSESLALPLDQITKRGAGSYVLARRTDEASVAPPPNEEGTVREGEP